MEKKPSDDVWYWFLTGEKRETFPILFGLVMDIEHAIFNVLPGRPRCIHCDMPLAGPGGLLLKPLGARVSTFNPHLCGWCEGGVRKDEGGVELELTMLFADVRDSTPLAESNSTAVFASLIQKFYRETTAVLVQHNALINRLMGDQVIALFVPRFAGKHHAKVAVHAASQLLHTTGHGNSEEPWIPVGVGIHTGTAYVGSVGAAKGVNEIAVLGSAANMCARLSSKAAAGEILISEDSVKSGNLDVSGLESRLLELKGVSQPVSVRVLKV